MPSPDTRVERDFWGPSVDDPAALVHAKLLTTGARSLTVEDKKNWSPFLVSLMLRGPRMIAQIRERGRKILAASLDENPNDYLEARGDAPEASLREWIEKQAPDLLDDLGVMTLPELAFSERLNLALLNVRWATRSVDKAKFDLLISDIPVVLGGSLGGSFLLALPISPSKAFLAFSREETLENMQRVSHDEFVKKTNLSTVAGADRYVFGTSSHQEPFVRKHLRQLLAP